MPQITPLFPLPNVLLYPGAILPLHIFEPRYLDMVAAFESSKSRLIVIGLLEGNWQSDYFEQPRVHPIAGLGEIAHISGHDGPRRNILVRGLSKVRISEEVEGDQAWRRVTYELLQETPLQAEAEATLRHQLHLGLEQFAGDDAVLDPKASTAWMVDMLLIALPIPMEQKYRLFSNLDIQERAHGVLQLLEENSRNQMEFSVAASQGDSAAWN